MKILHLDTGKTWRGGQAQVLRLMDGLAEHGHASWLLAPDGPLAARAREAGHEVETWNARGDLDLGAAWRVWRRIGVWGPDLVHAHTARAHALGVPAAVARGVPAVVSRRVALPLRPGASGLKYRLRVERYLCVSASVREEMRRGGVPAERLVVVPSGIPIPASPPPRDPGLAEEIGAGDAPVVGTLAALTAEKNPHILARAARRVIERVPAARFVWIGDGPLRAALEQETRRLGIERCFHVLGPREDAPRLLQGMSLFVLPSTREGLSNSVMEAQAAGVPVIVTGEGGVRELVEDRVNGRWLAAGDDEALALAIVEALLDPERAAAWARRARETVRAYSVEAMVGRTIAEYSRVLAERAPSPRG